MKKLIIIFLCVFSMTLVGQNKITPENVSEYIKTLIEYDNGVINTFKIHFNQKNNKELKGFHLYGKATKYIALGWGAGKTHKKYKCEDVLINGFINTKNDNKDSITKCILTNGSYTELDKSIAEYSKNYSLKNIDIFNLVHRNFDKWYDEEGVRREWYSSSPTKIIIDSIVLVYADNSVSVLKKYSDTNYYVNEKNSKYIVDKNKSIEKETEDSRIMWGILTIIIIISVIGLLLYFSIKTQSKKIDKENKRIDNLKQLYQNTKKPILLIKTQMSTSQNQTRQIVSGALLYQTPKTYTLEVHCKNISDKIVTAVEFEIETRNAFNEITSTFSRTSSKRMTFDNYIICNWESDSTVDIQNTNTTIKRVMFEDGTIWNN